MWGYFVLMERLCECAGEVEAAKSRHPSSQLAFDPEVTIEVPRFGPSYEMVPGAGLRRTSDTTSTR